MFMGTHQLLVFTWVPSDTACVEVNTFGFEDNILMT